MKERCLVMAMYTYNTTYKLFVSFVFYLCVCVYPSAQYRFKTLTNDPTINRIVHKIFEVIDLLKLKIVFEVFKQ